jgi:hypothetical protein
MEIPVPKPHFRRAFSLRRLWHFGHKQQMNTALQPVASAALIARILRRAHGHHREAERCRKVWRSGSGSALRTLYSVGVCAFLGHASRRRPLERVALQLLVTGVLE